MQAAVAKGNGANVLNAAQPPGPVRFPRVARLAPTLGLLRGAGGRGNFLGEARRAAARPDEIALNTSFG